MFGRERREDVQVDEVQPVEEEQVSAVREEVPRGTIPDVAPEPEVVPEVAPDVPQRTGRSASDQAYEPVGTAVPRTSPSKKGKDPKYKTKAWASARLFEQLDNEQRAILDDYATTEASRRAVPRASVETPTKAEAAPDLETTPEAECDKAETAVTEATEQAAAEAASETETNVPEPTAGAVFWGQLDIERRAGFLNITAAMKGNHFKLDGLKLLHDGIHPDRLLFAPSSAAQIKTDLENAMRNRKILGDRGFKYDKPIPGKHPGMAEWGGRQCVTKTSMQVGGGDGGVFVDIDVFNPDSNVGGLFGHIFEVLIPGGTDPFDIARELDKRGDDP
jgi:hypothetical protein